MNSTTQSQPPTTTNIPNTPTPTPSLITPEQKDIANRLGEVAALIAVSKIRPDILKAVPNWLIKCLRNLSEVGAQGAGDAINGSFESTFTLGYVMGQLSVWISAIKKPHENWDGQAMRQFLDHYFNIYTQAIARMTGTPLSSSSNIFAELAVATFGVFVASDYEQRREFVRGMGIALDAERNLREDALRETEATEIYLYLLLYAPEIIKMKSLSEVYQLLQERFSHAPSALGGFPRFRKLANRIELSFREQQS